MKRILVVNVNWLGDVVFSTPLLRVLRRAHPDAYIACLLQPRCREVLEGNLVVDDLLIYDEEEAHRGLAAKWRLVRMLRAQAFDEVYLLHRSFTKALMVALAGVPRRIGYPTKRRGWLLTVRARGRYDERHRVEYYLELGRAAGVPVEGEPAYEFAVTQQDREWADRFLQALRIGPEEQAVALNPGGNWPPKRWPAEHYADLGRRLDRQGIRIVITGGPDDGALAASIAERIGGRAGVAAGRATLKQTAALFVRSHVVVANDSGPMHIAVAMGAKVVALFGPTSPRLTGPYGRGAYRVLRESPVPPGSRPSRRPTPPVPRPSPGSQRAPSRTGAATRRRPAA
jgi:lipopolysaccharide heptosyltransferase II